MLVAKKAKKDVYDPEEEKELEKIVLAGDGDVLLNLSGEESSASDEDLEDQSDSEKEPGIEGLEDAFWKSQQVNEVEEHVSSPRKTSGKIKEDKKLDKKAAWDDEDDHLEAGAAFQQNSYLPRKMDPGQTYKSYLESKFVSINKEPKWARMNQKKKPKRRRDSSEEEGDEEDITKTATSYVTESKSLPKNLLNFKKCLPINVDLKRAVSFRSFVCQIIIILLSRRFITR